MVKMVFTQQCASDIYCSYGSSFPFRSIHGYGSQACSSTALSAVHVDYSKKLKLKHDIQLDSSAALRVGPADTVDGSNKSNYNSEKATPVNYAKPLRLSTSNASGLTLDGYRVEHDETSNNDVLCNLCENGKLMEACNLVDVMARLSQVPDLQSCVNLIRGLINVARIEKATRVLQERSAEFCNQTS
ncbi:PPR repeat [Musa troglodytarum]|uniref:PPR repeat n=1 Tax=Musa troglodytarum TaxID=320322 RepID=A0A9E7EP21_9LILI|nr:PPR repeat [Musa troglodytarum]